MVQTKTSKSLLFQSSVTPLQYATNLINSTKIDTKSKKVHEKALKVYGSIKK